MSRQVNQYGVKLVHITNGALVALRQSEDDDDVEALVFNVDAGAGAVQEIERNPNEIMVMLLVWSDEDHQWRPQEVTFEQIGGVIGHLVPPSAIARKTERGTPYELSITLR